MIRLLIRVVVGEGEEIGGGRVEHRFLVQTDCPVLRIPRIPRVNERLHTGFRDLFVLGRTIVHG
jgi:hypothetical protein